MHKQSLRSCGFSGTAGGADRALILRLDSKETGLFSRDYSDRACCCNLRLCWVSLDTVQPLCNHLHVRIQALHEPRLSCHRPASPALKKLPQSPWERGLPPAISTETTKADGSALATISAPCCDPSACDRSYFAGLISARGCSERDLLLPSQTV